MEQVRAGTLEESARAKRWRRLRTLGGSLFPRRSGNPLKGDDETGLEVWNLDSTPHSCGSNLRSRCQDAPFSGLEGLALEERGRGARGLSDPF